MKDKEALEYILSMKDSPSVPLMLIKNKDTLNDVLGTVVAAVEKRIPKKPWQTDTYIDDGWRYVCPVCGLPLGVNSKDKGEYTFNESFCPSCGQAIEWDKQ